MPSDKTNLQIMISKKLEEKSSTTVTPFEYLSPEREAIYDKAIAEEIANYVPGKTKTYTDVDVMIAAIQAEKD